METFKMFCEGGKVNKFNIHWQIVRTKARRIKDATQKIEFVMDFLKSHANQYNYERVLNWLKMTSVAYPEGSEQREAFKTAIQNLPSKESLSGIDDNNDLTKIPTEDLQLVLNDLKTRKYNFQFNRIPKDHIEFVNRLEQELQNR